MNRRELLQMTLSSALMNGKPASDGVTEHKPIQTGLKEFDDLTGGLPPGSLTVLYGPLKGGKTTLAMNIAEHVAVEEKRPVLFLVQDFSTQTLLGQMASSRARVDWLDVAEGKLGAEEVRRFQAAGRELGTSSLVVDDMPALEDAEIVERIEVWARDNPSGLAIVDHIWRDSWKEVGRCSRAMKWAAIRSGAAVIATAWHASIEDNQRSGDGVGTSHADFSLHLFRWWCSLSNLYPRDEVSLSIFDRRTDEQRLSLDVRLDEKFRRVRVVESKPCSPSLREERLEHPSGLVYHKILRPGEDAPPGSTVIYVGGFASEAEIMAWESPRWDV